MKLRQQSFSNIIAFLLSILLREWLTWRASAEHCRLIVSNHVMSHIRYLQRSNVLADELRAGKIGTKSLSCIGVNIET